jgi:hypothetical protein
MTGPTIGPFPSRRGAWCGSVYPLRGTTRCHTHRAASVAEVWLPHATLQVYQSLRPSPKVWCGNRI